MTVEGVRAMFRRRIERGAPLDEVDPVVRMTRGLRSSERRGLWRFAWNYDPRAPGFKRGLFPRSVRSPRLDDASAGQR